MYKAFNMFTMDTNYNKVHIMKHIIAKYRHLIAIIIINFWQI